MGLVVRRINHKGQSAGRCAIRAEPVTEWMSILDRGEHLKNICLVPYEHLTLGLKFNFRVGQLTGRDVLVVTCEECHWTSNVAPHVLYARYHDYTKVMQVQRDMVCKKCGRKGDLAWRVERATGPEWPKLA